MIFILVILTGLMAGIYFTFSIFVIKALSELPRLAGALAMNKINDVIVNTLFLPVFFVSTLWHAGVIVWAIVDWQAGRSPLFIGAAVIYVLGMFTTTVLGNVPLNNQLKRKADAYEKGLGDTPNQIAVEELEACWQAYIKPWLGLNHIRSLSCIAAMLLMLLALNH